ncbi:hypothetical protein [Brevundimonas bacteroides]|uniref:hypothetical protein n=1 Tax=Brevundimonas bacteroides TaxID=74311 RepID=UPI000496CBE9|nr:hypothetical protein [Brevundimonas bacteroides]
MSRHGQKPPTMDPKLFVQLGIGDIVLGLGLAAAALLGLLGDVDRTLVAGIGGVIAVIGVGIVIWARSRMDGGAR